MLGVMEGNMDPIPIQSRLPTILLPRPVVTIIIVDNSSKKGNKFLYSLNRYELKLKVVELNAM